MGSLLMMVGVVGLSMGAVFLANVTLFLLRQHGPMGQWRLQVLLSSFPIWVPLLAALSVVGGILLLRKYDFSYKQNFWLIVAGFIISIILATFVLDYLGLNDLWSRQGPMKRLYQQVEGQNGSVPIGQGQGRGHGRGQGWGR